MSRSFPASLLKAATAVLFLFALSFNLWAQGPESARVPAADRQAGAAAIQPIPNRLTSAIEGSPLRPLARHLPLWARAENDLGPATADMALTLVLSRTPVQQAALEKLLADQKNPSSPEYHHWLTPVEMGQRFGLSAGDLQTIKTWLEGQGLALKWTAPSGIFIGFGGPAATVGRAFGTEVHRYRVNGEERISVASDPMIPATLGSVVQAIHGMYTVEDQPSHELHVEQADGPQLTLSDGSHFITQQDFQTIYDDALTYEAMGQTIGIVGRSRVNFADLTNFRQLAGAGQPPTEVVPTALGGVDPGPALTSPPAPGVSAGDQSEATLDVERSGSVASAANLLLVVATQASGGIEVDAQYLVQTSPVPAQVMTISFGACESAAGPAGVNYWNALFQQAAAEGISVFVSSGDSGASGCEAAFTTPLSNPPAISPNYICSSSYATCVGGTEFNDASNPSTYWNSNGSQYFSSAKSYIPEGGWNEPLNASSAPQIASSGGGVSSVIATPSWQTGPGVPSARTGRYTPDVSFSSSCHDGYFGCFAAGGGSCVADSNGAFHFVGYCGTSAAAPSMAGVAALVNQLLGYPQGNINPEIYALAQNAPSSFHDATPATSGVAACSTAPSMCNNSTPGPSGLSGGQAGYSLATGYDPVTGVGSPDIAKFINNFATALPTPTVTVTGSATTITSLQTFTVSITVAGGTGQPLPTGSVTVRSGTYASDALPLVNGAASVVIPSGTLNLGPGNVSVQYLPDLASVGTYSQSWGSCTVTVNGITPTITAVFTPPNPTTAQDLTIKLTVNGGSGAPIPTGGISIDETGQDNSTQTLSAALSGGSATFVFPAGSLSPGVDGIDVNYTPDAASSRIYNSRYAPGYIPVTAAPKTTPQINVALSSSVIAFTDPLVMKIVVQPAPGGPVPTGSISVTGSVQILSANLVAGSAQITVSPLSLPIANDVLTVSYLGDYNNSPTTTTAAITVTKGTPTIVVTPANQTEDTQHAFDVLITAQRPQGAPAPTGPVTLTSGSYASLPALLSGGSATIHIPAGALAVGTDTLSASYIGDGNYNSAAGTASVVVNAVPALSLTSTAVNLSAAGATSGNTSTITITPSGGFTGHVVLSTGVTAGPLGAQNVPTLTLSPGNALDIADSNPVTLTLTVTTTPHTTSAGLVRPVHPGTPWYAAGETVLGCLLLLGSRVRRGRRWLVCAGITLLLVAFSNGVLACGGGGGGAGGGSGSGGPSGGTTSGTYSVTVTATSGTIVSKSTFTLVVP